MAKKPASGFRARFESSAEELQEAIHPFIRNTGFIQYVDNFTGAKINVKEIQLHKKLILALYRLQPNLSFKKLTLQKALEGVAVNRKFGLDNKMLTQWASDMDLRVRVMLRHVAQSRADKPWWIQA